MHKSVLAWFANGALSASEVEGRAVLEVGSYDVNGTVRPLVERHGPASYLGVDAQAGPGVDEVCDATDLPSRFGPDAFDVVVSCEMLEHAEDWRACLVGAVTVLRAGGLLLLTTRGPGFPRHEFPGDHWRFTVPAMSQILAALGCGSHEVCPDPQRGAPGVFAKARKSDPWTWSPERLDSLDVAPAPAR